MSEGNLGPDPRHRVAAFVASTHAAAGELADAPLWSMGAAEAASTLVELTRLRAQVAELELRVARHAESVEVGLEVGATSTANWWAHTTKLTRAGAHRLTKLASRLEAHEPVRAALAAGAVLVDQAAVIVDAVDALPGDLVDDTTRGEAADYLLAEAAHHDAKALRVLGRRILDVVAPEVGEAHEARLLEAEEGQGPGGGVVHDVRGRPRHLPRPVRHLGPARGDAAQAPARVGRPPAPRQPPEWGRGAGRVPGVVDPAPDGAGVW